MQSFSIKVIYGWAHLTAIFDSLFRRNMEWHPTGAAGKRSLQYVLFRCFLVFYSLVAALLWIGGAAWHMMYWNMWDFSPVFVSGAIFLFVVLRIVFASMDPKPPAPSSFKTSAQFAGRYIVLTMCTIICSIVLIKHSSEQNLAGVNVAGGGWPSLSASADNSAGVVQSSSRDDIERPTSLPFTLHLSKHSRSYSELQKVLGKSREENGADSVILKGGRRTKLR